MEKKTKKPAVKATTKKVKPETKKTTEKVESKIDNNEMLRTNITKLESAYVAAISGKMKFAQVKDIFKKIHKEIKQSNKK